MSEDNNNGTNVGTHSNNETRTDDQDETTYTKNITDGTSTSIGVTSEDADQMDAQFISNDHSLAGIETPTKNENEIDAMDTTVGQPSDSKEISSSMEQVSDATQNSPIAPHHIKENNSANDNDNQNQDKSLDTQKSSETAPLTLEPVPSEQSNNDHNNSLPDKETNIEDSGHTQNGEGSEENDASMETNPSEHGIANDDHKKVDTQKSVAMNKTSTRNCLYNWISKFFFLIQTVKASLNDTEALNPTTEHLLSANPTTTNETINDIELTEKESIDSEDDENEPSCPVCTSGVFNHQPINNTTSDTGIDKSWLYLQYHDDNKQRIKKPNEIEDDMQEPPGKIDEDILDRIQGSIIGMALGDALGAHVEFRPRKFLVEKPVKDLEGGGTWGLEKGQFTDDTTMALCLANSLIACHGFNAYDQLVRYKWWYNCGYMSSTGQCFDIGNATRQSIVEFERRQEKLADRLGITLEQADSLSDPEALKQFDVNCSYTGVAGNGALMRLTPVPLFFYEHPEIAVELSGQSGRITHGDDRAYDACRYYGALIVAALMGHQKKQLLSKNFYSRHKSWFGTELHSDVKSIAEGSFKNKKGYDGGIRGKGYIINALEAALWAFWSNDSFETGALAAVNLGDDTDTTAAIYGQLAGAFYGYKNLPLHWLKHVYAHKFLKTLSKWIAYEGQRWQKPQETSVQQ